MSKNNEVNTTELKDIIRFSLENVETQRLPFCIWGSHGIGKTEIVGQVAREVGYNLITVHLSTQDITDLIGIPYQDAGVQRWSVPQWLSDALDNYKKTGIPNLFFLDEMNRGHAIVLKAMLPFLLDGTLHLHKIGPKDCVIAANNPPDDKYDVNDMADKALNDRLGHVIFKPTQKEYFDFCQKNGIDKTTMSVLKKNGDFVSVPKNDFSVDISPSRRAIFNVMKVVGKKDSNWIRNRGGNIIECYLGKKFKDYWMEEYVKSQDNEDITIDILKDFKNNKTFIVDKITRNIDGLLSCSIDTVEHITSNIMSYMEDNKTTLTTEDISWITSFYSLPIIPEEIAKKVFDRNPILNYYVVQNKVINRMVGDFVESKNIFKEEESLKW